LASTTGVRNTCELEGVDEKVQFGAVPPVLA
jgi:hypothetical protein